MKKIITITLLLLVVAACKKEAKKTIEEILSSNNLTEIRKHKEALITEQLALSDKVKLLDAKIAELDDTEKKVLVTVKTIATTSFSHYVELQGNVNTNELLVLHPEFSGILTSVLVKEGQKVRKGQVLAKIDDAGLSQQLAQLQIRSNLAKTTFERQERLWKQKIGSEIQYLQTKSNFNAQQEAVIQMQKQVAKTIIKAPFSGTIDEVITDRGSVVSAGMTPIIRIVNLRDMHIEADVPENYINTVTKGKKVSVYFPVLNKNIKAQVRQVGEYINPSNRTFKVEVAVPNKDKNIKPNLTAKLKINDYTNPKALLIPQNIISENAKGEKYIYTIKKKGDKTIAVKTFIKTGLSQNNLIEIIEGLKPADKIIMEGARVVKNNQEVSIID